MAQRIQDRGKRRSKGQRLGEEGERLFALWATENGLSPNKVEADYGVDFFCQIFYPAQAQHQEELSGAILAVQVKSTEGHSRPRVKLLRQDAVNLLRQTHPVALFAVQIEQRCIRFRFLDETFIDFLMGFLKSENTTVSLPFRQMEEDIAVFRRQLAELSRPGTQYRLSTYKATRNILRLVPDAKLSIQYVDNHNIAVLNVPSMSSVLEINPEWRDTEGDLYAITQEGESSITYPGLVFKREFTDIPALGSAVIIQSGPSDAFVEIKVMCGLETVRATFQSAKLMDRETFVHPVGLRLIVLNRQKIKGEWKQGFGVERFRGPISIGQATNILPLLRLLRPGANILVNGSPAYSKGWSLVASYIGPDITALERITEILGLDLKQFYLADFSDKEFYRSFMFLKSFVLDGKPLNNFIGAFGFCVDSAEALQGTPTQPALVELPVVMNLGSQGIVVWTRMRCAAYTKDGNLWCGLRFDEQLSWSAELHPRFNKSVYPEIWTFKNWPPLLLGAMKNGLSSFKPKSLDYIRVEARVLSGFPETIAAP